MRWLREQYSGVKHFEENKTAWRRLFIINVQCSPNSIKKNSMAKSVCLECIAVLQYIFYYNFKLIACGQFGNREWKSTITLQNPYSTLFPQYRPIPKQWQHILGFSSGPREMPLPSPTVLPSIVICKTSTCSYINSKNTTEWLFVLQSNYLRLPANISTTNSAFNSAKQRSILTFPA